ncbi:hypothetical protein ASPZODRAFT_137660 [Penicilliopsis zonata CBS 506.65]|uniref:Acid phosphatase n=1 Tax=Penicilliopsis zonata CBS 506.65 TaxID=1073090 RepID=A0A1L9STH1_9EURO|nr:hypothetical protein ASPZODRAFT_137660 [Penicilliopsis zonata CBS 506.65]OJJ50500.1 hypothetical protein ASPZODRAFT_137660 [Penicilliopsis zonata CBS 506.65]
MQTTLAVLAAGLSLAAAQTINTSEPTLAEIRASQAVVKPYSPTSSVKGLAFDRFYQVWLENVDFTHAERDSDQEWLAKQGILLTNYFGTGHTSEPNYCSAASGDSYGMDNDDFHQIPTNVSTVADLLETKGISWGEYMEGLPFPGFQGYNFSNQETYANDYVRKHNPLILFDQITNNATSLRQIKNFTSFYDDLENETLPQWAFITPNMTNDAHDTNVTYATRVFLRPFVENLMNNTYFWNNTLLMLTFDESYDYPIPNRVYTILLGGAIPDHLIGTEDDTLYTHYSSLATVEANWGLPSLGRWDCGANIFQLVSNATGYTNYDVDTTNLLINSSLPGPLSLSEYSQYRSTWPVPATEGKCSAGNGILKSVVDMYKGREPTYNYTDPFPYDVSAGLDVGISFSRNGTVYVTGTNTSFTEATSNTSTSSSSSASSSATSGGAGMTSTNFGLLALGLAAFALA